MYYKSPFRICIINPQTLRQVSGAGFLAGQEYQCIFSDGRATLYRFP